MEHDLLPLGGLRPEPKASEESAEIPRRLKSAEIPRRAVLVGIKIKGGSSAWTLQDSLDELGQLASTAGLQVVGTTWQRLSHPDPATWIGSGKVQELRELLAAEEATFAIFDDELSPGQTRKIGAALGDGVRIIDRTRLILDIFSQHAHSREGQLQVELAQYQYLLPRLTGLRAGLSQQVGGAGAGPVGLRGPGETQLELDRRQVRRRISVLRGELETVRTHRRQQRRQRERTGVPIAAIVGYTNAGKSSLLNALTGAGVLVEDKLFATLDPTTRRLRLPGGREILLTDTVGFIRKLPHDLVASFRATLEGVEEASLIVHVVDGSHPHAVEQVMAVDGVLAGLSLTLTPRLVVWNKMDLLPDRALPHLPGTGQIPTLGISAKTGENLDSLLGEMETMLGGSLVERTVLIPYDRFELVGLAYSRGSVLSREDTAEGIRLRVSVPTELGEKLAPYRETHNGD
jgi:GTP-binding protein HflX